MDVAVDKIVQMADGLSPEWIIFVLAMLPLIELRLAIPVGLAMGVDPITTLIMALLGNALPVIPIVFLLPLLFDWFYKFKFLQPFMDKVVNKARARGKQIEKKGAIGLILFVGVPIPGTGVWTGCLLSYLLGLGKLYAIVAILIGMTLAGIMFTLSAVGLMEIFRFIADIEYILIALLLVGGIYYWHKNKKNK